MYQRALTGHEKALGPNRQAEGGKGDVSASTVQIFCLM
ncbi:hypothetical protein EYZ11_003798 [Aspergillus tanneri]|uniref:Uncharacterized protein n=1 Tax=Aspergillus tanneri TaxID=1220188 RepID=A0A4S3JMT1_9EURO|nr:hypothetical protein EYZ11_003798 [Aspergillus tanneri]